MAEPRFIPLVGALALAACVAPPVAAPPPAPPVRPAPPPPRPAAPPSAWTDRPLTPGRWVYREEPRGTIAEYGPAGSSAVLTLRCDRVAGLVAITRPGMPGRMTLTATTGARAYLAQAAGTGAMPQAIITLASRDPQLDAIAFSRGRFMVSLDNAPDLLLPSWAEVARVVEDCRS